MVEDAHQIELFDDIEVEENGGNVRGLLPYIVFTKRDYPSDANARYAAKRMENGMNALNQIIKNYEK